MIKSQVYCFVTHTVYAYTRCNFLGQLKTYDIWRTVIIFVSIYVWRL